MLIGKVLVDQGLISQKELDLALQEQKKNKTFLCKTIVRLGFAKEEDVLPLLSSHINIPYIRLKDFIIPKEVIQKIPARFSTFYKIVPFSAKDGTVSVAVDDPLNFAMLDDLRLILGLKIKPSLAGELDISESIKKYYGVGAGTVEEILLQKETKPGQDNGKATSDTKNIEEMTDEASVVNLVNEILLAAHRDRATDIHFEPYENDFRLRYRIDGILYDIKTHLDIHHLRSSIISRIKIMANLNIAEHRLPQDGRIRVRIKDTDLDLRVSILPSSYGEAVMIRLLSSNVLLGLESLGLLEGDLAILEEAIKKPYGIILVTGPTGSGKTTTLYACLSKINKPGTKILTIEDPIEYQLRGITQIQIHPQIGLTFAQGLRSMLRHDPDVMMVGEIRDLETAQISIRIAQTGHLVFSTLHTNDACGAVTRLLDMGIEPYLLASSCELFMAQRLVRLICPECKVKMPNQKQDEVLRRLGKQADMFSNTNLYEGKGCSHCRFTGYQGRTAIYEIVPLNNEIKELIHQRKTSFQINEKALSLGMRSLRQCGLEKAKLGLTTIDEVLRVA